jgi:hypothetical protein
VRPRRIAAHCHDLARVDTSSRTTDNRCMRGLVVVALTIGCTAAHADELCPQLDCGIGEH